MEKVLQLAEQLGQAISQSKRYLALRTAEKSVEADADAVKLQKAYTEIAQKIGTLEQEGKPIEAVDKRTLANCKQELAKNALILEVTKAWADYNEMILKVNELVFSKLGSGNE